MKKKRITVSIWLIAGLSLLILGVVVYVIKGHMGKEKVSVYEPQIMAQLPDGYAWDENEYLNSIEVINDRVIFEVQYTETVEKEDDNPNDNIVEFEMVKQETRFYEWDTTNNCMKRIEFSGYTVHSVTMAGERIYFVGAKGENLNLPEYDYYTAKIGENKIEDIQELKISDSKLDINQFCAASDDRLLFWAWNSEGGELAYYIGTVKDNVLEEISVIDEIEGNENLVTAEFVGNEPKILVSTIDWSMLESDGVWELEHRLLNLSKENRKQQKLEVDRVFVLDEYDFLPPVATEISKDAFYYLENDSILYKASLDGFLNEVVTDEENNQNYTTDDETYVSGQYSYDTYDVGDFKFASRNKAEEVANQGIYYEIFVRSYADSDGDGIGDFNGITNSLDYLKELGIDGIYLMPINESDSYHGYDVTDYMSLNSDYGTQEDFERLLSEAHKRDMKVIMDFVINHTSSEHPWFKEALKNENSEYRNYYRWVYKNDTADFDKNDKSNWNSRVWHKYGDSYYYGIFNAYMPDLNYNNPKVREEIKTAAGKWLEMGVDGFRLDAAMHIYGDNEFKQEENQIESTLQWWNEFALYCENINPEVYLVGECWQDYEVLEEYVQPFDTKFNFAIQQSLLDAVNNETAMNKDGENLSIYIQNILTTYDAVDTNYLDGVFGSNHDQNRIMSTVKTESKAKQVAVVYMTLPGNPYIYYGEELGMYGEKPDEYIRTPFLWGDDSDKNTTWMEDKQNSTTRTLEEQLTDETSMYSFYKEIIALRKENVALAEGNFIAVDTKNSAVMAYVRESDEQKVLVVHNMSACEQEIDLENYRVKNILYGLEENINEEMIFDKVTIGSNESIILEIE